MCNINVQSMINKTSDDCPCFGRSWRTVSAMLDKCLIYHSWYTRTTSSGSDKLDVVELLVVCRFVVARKSARERENDHLWRTFMHEAITTVAFFLHPVTRVSYNSQTWRTAISLKDSGHRPMEHRQWARQPSESRHQALQPHRALRRQN